MKSRLYRSIVSVRRRSKTKRGPAVSSKITDFFRFTRPIAKKYPNDCALKIFEIILRIRRWTISDKTYFMGFKFWRHNWIIFLNPCGIRYLREISISKRVNAKGLLERQIFEIRCFATSFIHDYFSTLSDTTEVVRDHLKISNHMCDSNHLNRMSTFFRSKPVNDNNR